MNARQQEIFEYITANAQVTIAELEALCPNVSSMTIRRDLQCLEQEGVLVRIHGGARSISSLSQFSEEVYTRRAVENVAQKKEIAQKAAQLVRAGSSVYLDAGSTAMYLAQCMPPHRLYITTSGPNIAIELTKTDTFAVNMLGGELNPDTISVSGPHSIEYIGSINIDTAFIAASGYSAEAGFTNGNNNECALKRAALVRARNRVVMMDSSKIGRTLPFTFANHADIGTLITDSGISAELRRSFEEQGVEVL